MVLNFHYTKHMFVTYALFSPVFNKIYVGYTSDLIDRYYSHNFLSTKGFTKNYRPWIVVYIEFHELKSAAIKREKELKTSSERSRPITTMSKTITHYKQGD